MGKKTVSFLASGRGSNFKAVAEFIRGGKLPARLGILLTDNKDAKALDTARGFGMEAFFIDPALSESREEHDRRMADRLEKAGTDLIVAAGYMRILSPYFVKNFRNRIINIHPALLPSFPGVEGQRKALEYGVKITGCTTHFIDEGMDTGPIILQAAVPVMDDDDLAALSGRILKEEHRILPESVRLFCEGKLTVKGRRVIVGS